MMVSGEALFLGIYFMAFAVNLLRAYVLDGKNYLSDSPDNRIPAIMGFIFSPFFIVWFALVSLVKFAIFCSLTFFMLTDRMIGFLAIKLMDKAVPLPPDEAYTKVRVEEKVKQEEKPDPLLQLYSEKERIERAIREESQRRGLSPNGVNGQSLYRSTGGS